MKEKKSSGKIIKYGAGTLLGISLIYGATKFKLAEKAEDFVNNAVSTVVDITSIDAGEASDDYITQLKEEDNISKYEGKINSALEEGISHVSDSSKVVFVEHTYDQLHDSLKQRLAQRSIDELNPELSMIVLKESIRNGSYELKKEIAGYSLNETLKNKKSNTEDDIKDFFKRMGKFFQDTYNTVEEKVKEVF